MSEKSWQSVESYKYFDGLERIKDPGIDPSSHHYISHYLIFEWLKGYAYSYTQGVMLDYGCGGQPYRDFFSSKISKYIGADVAAANEIVPDILIVPGERVPLADESVDTVLSTQTLEHVLDFNFYLAECFRLLRPGGALLLTAPMQWRLHEVPYDYFRFTRHGLAEVMAVNGFEVRHIMPCGGVYALLGQIFLSHLAEKGLRKKRLFRLVNRLAMWLDKKIPDYEDTLNWMCVGIKPAPQ